MINNIKIISKTFLVGNFKRIYISVGVVVLVLFVFLLVGFSRPGPAEKSVVVSQEPEMGISGTIEEVDAGGLMLTYPYPPSKLQKTVLFPILFAPGTKFFKLDKSAVKSAETPIKFSDLKSNQIVYVNYNVVKGNPGNELIAKNVYVINYAPTAKK